MAAAYKGKGRGIGLVYFEHFSFAQDEVTFNSMKGHGMAWHGMAYTGMGTSNDGQQAQSPAEANKQIPGLTPSNYV